MVISGAGMLLRRHAQKKEQSSASPTDMTEKTPESDLTEGNITENTEQPSEPDPPRKNTRKTSK